MGMTVTALGPTVVLILFLALIIFLISVDKLFGSVAVSLLEVKSTSVAQRLESCRFTPP